MKFLTILSAATLSSAIVLPEDDVIAKIQIERHRNPSRIGQNIQEKLGHVEDVVEEAVHSTKNAFDDVLARVSQASNTVYDKVYETGYDVESWLQDSLYSAELFDFRPPPPHHGDHEEHPPHHGPPHHVRPPHHKPPHRHEPNETVYELIAHSKYTTKLAKLINDHQDLVDLLNGTSANFTVFAPIDSAFEKIPEHAPKPSKEFIKAFLSYHVSPEFYPAGRVFTTHTIPTALESDSLGYKPLPQRLAVKLSFRGLSLNYYSHVVAADIFGTNGVIHGVDNIIIPPPKVVDIIQFLPGEFSTLTLGLSKTGLLEKFNTTDHAGGTLFAPSNFAFQKLGPRINAFLFSKYGEKYLKALLEYHAVPDNTLYSDAYYKADDKDESAENYPRSFHLDLPTLLEDHPLAIDVGRWGPFIEIKINGFSRVAVQDGVAKDGVIQVVGDVLIPPKRLSDKGEGKFWQGEEMDVEEFKDRLAPYVNEWQDL